MPPDVVVIGPVLGLLNFWSSGNPVRLFCACSWLFYSTYRTRSGGRPLLPYSPSRLSPFAPLSTWLTGIDVLHIVLATNETLALTILRTVCEMGNVNMIEIVTDSDNAAAR